MPRNFIFKIVLFNLLVISGLAEYLSLDGNEWHAFNQNKSIKTNAKVPGSIYSDLRRSHVLNEDIFKGDNDMKYRWVSYENWTYERTFFVDSSILRKQSVHLLAKGIDTVSTIYVNDQIVGKTNNQFIRYKLDVKRVLKTGAQNRIKIVFTSAQLYGKQQFDAYMKTYGYDVPPDCMTKEQNGECHYNFIRKMASSFSWDWGPAFPTQGIWKPIGIEAYDKAIIRDITVETTPNPENRSEWTLTVNAFIESSSDKQFDAVFNINLDDHNVVKNEKHSLKPNKDGIVVHKMVVTLKNMPITEWFPNGVAKNTQKLYKLKVSLSSADSPEVSMKTKKIGFRTIKLVQNPIKPEGLSFHFEVNDKIFWVKGTNWIPAHLLMEELTPKYVKHLMASAKEANMNMMRVWGGGVYESDLFYELADEMGIMIWQDFMFACALYPTDKDFLDISRTEVQQQVRRLQYHPSIAIWAGNNENEAALAGPWYPVVKGNVSLYQKDYVELYINQIKPAVLAEDKTRPFVSSSPSNGLEDEKEKWTAKNPGDLRYGDLHFYDYNRKLWDWKSFPSTRFASEYGFQSYPSLEAFSEVLDEKELTFPVSKSVDHRQHHGEGTQVLEQQSGLYFKLPTHGGVDRFDDLIYLTQITQSMAMKTETEFYRRNRAIDPKTGHGYTMGALYWQINDVWQAPTWASIEFGGKWKMIHYYAKNFLDNLLISPYEDTNQTLKVSLVRDDYNGEKEFDLSVKVYKWSENKPIHEIKTKVKTNSFSADVVYTKSIPELLSESKCKDRTECVLSFGVIDSDQVNKAHNFMLLSEPKNSQLVKPNVKLVDVKKNPKSGALVITLSTEAVAPFVSLDFKLKSGIRGHFSDNGFFIFGNTKIIEFYPDSNVLSETQIRDHLTIKTVTDVK